jgi:membrane peptidoglycan carboxypeptidase
MIVNDGVRRPAGFIRRLRFGAGTPYETTFQPVPAEEHRVISRPVARALRSALAMVVEGGTARRIQGSFRSASGQAIAVGGKTGSGDNRVDAVNSSGYRMRSRSLNRTATFVFYVGDRCYGVVTALVDGPAAAHYEFTSALPIEVLRRLAPEISARVEGIPTFQTPDSLYTAAAAGKPTQVAASSGVPRGVSQPPMLEVR